MRIVVFKILRVCGVRVCYVCARLMVYMCAMRVMRVVWGVGVVVGGCLVCVVEKVINN